MLDVMSRHSAITCLGTFPLRTVLITPVDYLTYLLTVRQDPLDLSFWLFLTSLHRFIEKVGGGGASCVKIA